MDGRDKDSQAHNAFQVEIAGADVRFPCRADQSLLAAMIASGQRSLTVGCRSGGCGVCRSQILSGRFSTGHMNRAVVSIEDEQAGVVLACRTYPSSDIRMQALPRTDCQQQPTMVRAA